MVKNAPKETRIIFWVNAKKEFDFGEFKNMGICIQTRIPNILFNICASIFRYPKIDRLIQDHLTTLPPYHLTTLFVPDPRPSPVSSQCQKIITVHDLSSFRFPETFALKTRFFHKLIRLKKEITESTKVIAVSEFTKHEILDYQLCESEKIEIVHEAAEPEYFDEAVPAQKPVESLPQNFFLSLSTLEPRKNLKTLITAFLLVQKEKPDLQLVLVGKKNPQIFTELNLDQHSNITCIERFMSIAEKKWLYQKATGFLFLSKYEGFGLPILEAMSQGCLVICGNNSAQKEVVGTAGILVDVQDVSVIAQVILSLEENKGLRNYQSEQSLARAKTFSWKKSSVKILTFLPHCCRDY